MYKTLILNLLINILTLRVSMKPYRMYCYKHFDTTCQRKLKF